MSYEPRRTPRHEIVRLRGRDTHLTHWGPPAGGEPPLVFLHGFLDTSDTFQFVVDALAREQAIAAPDWRGFGRSHWQHEPYWFPNYFADLEALLDRVAPGRAVRIVGHSMGGNIAALYAGIRPERVERLVNLEGFGLPRTAPERAPERYREWLDALREPKAFGRYASLEQFAQVLARKNPRLPLERARFVARQWALELPDGGYTANFDPAHRLPNPVLYRRDEAEACWRRVTAPTLLVLGELSEYRPGLGADGADAAFHALYRDLEIATLPGAGHMLHHEQPEAVAALIDRFLG
ncbi:MAG: alpha/beta hydrolase [Steroidobacteraceae bacterium]|jgi:pimeloyl-ACP methyl ester carboxylesterase|nr:alpha/beta hydrolase [Steroidobacteraceae bacterium]